MQNLPINKLQTLAINQTLPHAWIFTGDDNDHSQQSALEFCQWLLCSDKCAQVACGQCRACHLFVAHTHPDFCGVFPLDDKRVITIDAIRGRINDFSNGKPQLGEYKIVLISPASALHRQAANALLKTLEEPRGNSIFILISSHVDLLPKTIVSRCHILNLGSLLIIGDTGLQVLQEIITDLEGLWLKKSVTCSQIVERWAKLWPNQVLYWFEIVLTDIIRFKYTGDLSQAIAWFDANKQLSTVLPASKFWTILERLREAQSCFGQNHKPNLQLVLEHALLV